MATTSPTPATDAAASNPPAPPSTPPAPAPPAPPSPAPVQSGTVTLVTVYPTTSFDHGVDGADPITIGGTTVPAALVQAIEAAAERYGVKVVQVVIDDAEKPVAKFLRRVGADIERGVKDGISEARRIV